MNLNFKSIFSFSYLKGYEFDNFQYEDCELIYFIHGEGLISIDHENFTYKSHSICFSKELALKDLRCLKKTDYICIRFSKENLPFDLENGIYPVTSKNIYLLFQEILQEYTEKKPYYFSYCNLKIEEILLHLARNENLYDENSIPIYKLIQEIDSMPCFSKNVKEMAICTGYSYDHFRHKFKQITGIPPADYVLNKRLENACKLLSEGKLSCSEIAEFCNFSSPSQFSTLFKKKMGIVPKEYIKKI